MTDNGPDNAPEFPQGSDPAKPPPQLITMIRQDIPPAQLDPRPPARVVVGIRVRARIDYDDDGTIRPKHSEFVLPSEIASQQIQSGRVTFIRKVLK